MTCRPEADMTRFLLGFFQLDAAVQLFIHFCKDPFHTPLVLHSQILHYCWLWVPGPQIVIRSVSGVTVMEWQLQHVPATLWQSLSCE